MQKIITVVFLLQLSATTQAQYTLQPVLKKQSTLDSLKNIPLRLLSANYYTNNLPFFCKKELQIEKLVKVPFKFRIGSVEEVDKLEGKHLVRP